MLPTDAIANMTSLVNRSLDVTVTLYRNTVGTDGYGHQTVTPVSQGTISVNVYQPRLSQLQTYASIIGAQKSMMLRYASGTDIKSGDIIQHDGRNWLVHVLEYDTSYTFADNALMIEVS